MSGYQSLAENVVQAGAHGADRLIQTVAQNTPDPQLQLAHAATYLGASRNPALRAPVAEALEA
ncbi:MAG: hypothetical protein ACRD0U_03415, partial [Acidimicrobiales bacterium]